MKLKLIVISVFSLFALNQASAQLAESNAGVNDNYSKFTEVFILGGSAGGNFSVFNLSDYRSLVPSSSYINSDFSGYNFYTEGQAYDNSYFGVMLGMVLNKARRQAGKSSPLLRFGFNFESGAYASTYLSDEISSRYDTLFNSQGQAIYFRDSVDYKYVYADYSSSAISSEFSVLMRTNTARRWSFYAGAGLSFGVSINNTINVDHYEVSYLEENYVSGGAIGTNYHNYANRSNENYYSEAHNIGTSWVTSGFIPLGIDFRLAKKHELVKHFHLFSEMRPGVKVMGVPDLRTISGTYFMGSFGLRVDWR